MAAVIADLVSSRPLAENVAEALESIRLQLDLAECAIWQHSKDGLVRSWGAGESAIGASEVQARLARREPAPDPIVVIPVGAGDRPIGALAVRASRDLGAEESVLLTAVANLVGSVLANAAQHRLLELEVDARTVEIHRERIFTEKIVDSLPLGLYVVDRDYRIRAWNRKRETGMQGVSRDEAIGRTIFEILHRQPPEMLRREFDDVFSTGRIQEYQMESRATGELRTYRVTKVPMRVGDSAVTHVITIGEDVTDWKDAHVRASQAEKMAALGQLAAGVMHEINNPLATIAACAESLGFKMADLEKTGVAIPAGANEYVQIIDTEVLRCKEIVDSLLDFSRPKQVLKERASLNDVIERTLMLLKHHVRFKKLSVITELDADLASVPQASGEQLLQVFMALLINAMDAMAGTGQITIRTRRGTSAEEGAIAEVIDTGQGIARSELSKIFEPFYTTKPPGRGTGLGLSICYSIIREHGGRIEVESEAGKGSTFRVLLPTEERR